MSSKLSTLFNALGEDAPRFLLVDDSEDDALLLELRLRKRYAAAEFARVERGEDMARALSSSAWDMVISDESMPRFSSQRALEVLRASGQELPFIIYSGQLADEAGVDAMHLGASDFVHKSTPARLLAVVEREMQNSRLRREKTRAERSAASLAQFDPLTGLPNRDAFVDRVTKFLAAEPGVCAALLHLDLDRFMRINDSIGYAGGDAIMCKVGARLAAWARDSSEVARLGHDEFGIFIAGRDAADGASAYAQAVLELFTQPYTWEGGEFFLTATVGVALFPEHGEDVATLLKNAESATVAAKQLGVQRFETYRTELNQGAALALRLECDLQHAVEREELFVQYQPIVDLRTRGIVGTEALLRWRHPELGIVPPDRFIGIADETGLIVPIGEWVLRTACAQTHAWHQAGFPELTVAVNFSGAQFDQVDIAARIESVLVTTGLEGRFLHLEITETVAMRNAEVTIRTLRRLSELGVRVSIDDFGTGYSSLAYLKRFPLHVLKIDRTFLGEVHEGSEDAAIVHAIIALGRALKLTVLAEGVETAEQLAFLAKEGCDYAQGYYLARPLDPHAAQAMLVSASTMSSFALSS